METIPERKGRYAFGQEFEAYRRTRPAYPDWMFHRLMENQALKAGTATLEVGPGTGIATERLAELGASPLVLVEPDHRFAPLLEKLPDFLKQPCRLVTESFEEADLEPSSFDLIVAATAFHWLDPDSRVERLAALTKHEGHVALLWNVFHNPNLPDAFHEATKSLLTQHPSSPSNRPGQTSFALDKTARQQEFSDGGYFELKICEESHWTLSLDAAGTRDLYSSFSNIVCLDDDERTATLDKIEKIAATNFSNKVERNMVSILYLFQRTHSTLQ